MTTSTPALGMMLATVALHQSSLVSADNPLGATRLFLDRGAAGLAELCADIAGQYDGVMLQRFHGSFAQASGGETVGLQPDGDRIDTYVAGPEDRFLSDEELEAWRGLAARTKLFIYTVMPRSDEGFRALERTLAIEPHAVVLDVAGQNESVLASRAVGEIHAAGVLAVPEPSPLSGPVPFPNLRPRWMSPRQYTAAMPERWRTLRKRGTLPKRGLVIYNGNRGGDNYWNADEARAWREAGLDVAAPAEVTVPAWRDMVGGDISRR